MKPYAKFGILTVLIVGSLVWLAMGGIKRDADLLRNHSGTAQDGEIRRRQAASRRGDVQTGTIVKTASNVSFVIHENGQLLKVVYIGSDPLPDTFKGGAKALADGGWLRRSV